MKFGMLTAAAPSNPLPSTPLSYPTGTVLEQLPGTPRFSGLQAAREEQMPSGKIFREQHYPAKATVGLTPDMASVVFLYAKITP